MADPTIVDRTAPEPIPLLPVRDQERLGARLPVQLTSFIGREREVEQISALLQRDNVRLLTLTGPGGVGKTRLAVRVAEALKRYFAEGIVFVPLAPVADPEIVAATVAQALGIWEISDWPIVEHLIAVLRDRHVLLMLDNFEHVLPAATLVTDLVTGCSQLTLLVTSRASLQISGEHQFPVPPLDLPGHALPTATTQIERTEAVQLFVERAQAAKPDFTLTNSNAATVGEVCQRLDGLPLAIELAAARVNILPPPALLIRLNQSLALLTGGPKDAPIRLQSMREAIAWSYDLLTAEEQALFRRLAVFAGGFNLDAAEAVAGDGVGDVFEGVASLVSKSLLRQEPGPDEEPRFFMLETIREFGLACLFAAGEQARTQYAHATYYLVLGEQAESAYFGTAESRWFARLESELANLRAALETLAAQGKTGEQAQLASALWWFWRAHGHVREGAAWLSSAVESSIGEPTLQARVLIRAGYLAHVQGEISRAVDLLESGITLAREAGSERSAAEGQIYLADAMVHLYELERATALLTQAQPVWEALNEPTWMTRTLMMQALVAFRLFQHARAKEDYARAKEVCEQALALARSCDFTYGIANSLILLAGVALSDNDFGRAASLYAGSLTLCQSWGDTVAVVDCFARLAQIAHELGDGNRAARLAGATEALREAHGIPIDPTTRPDYEHALDALRAELGESAFEAAFGEGRLLTLAEAKAEALAVPLLGDTAQTGAPDRASNLGLTPRELEVLRLVAAGCSDREIADALFIARTTASDHVSHILSKLGAATRAEAAAWAVRNRLA